MCLYLFNNLSPLSVIARKASVLHCESLHLATIYQFLYMLFHIAQ